MIRISFIVLICLIHFYVKGQPVLDHGRLKVEALRLKDEKGNDVVLRGMSLGWHNWWPRFYNKDVVHWLHRDWGISVIRVAMGVEPEQGYLAKPQWSKELVYNVIDAAIEENIYVIVDWHSHNINLQEAKEFFKEIAWKYGDRPHIIYEIFNEPDQESWKEVKEYSIEVLQLIRSIDPDNIVLVGSPHWDQDLHLAADDPIKGFANIMYSLHFYAATHKQWQRDRADDAMRRGLPVFISESAGMEASGDGALDIGEWTKWIEWAEERKISWIVWSVTDKNETCSVLLPKASSEGGWADPDLKESGLKAREFIRKYKAKR